jgi:hypothetical protein
MGVSVAGGAPVSVGAMGEAVTDSVGEAVMVAVAVNGNDTVGVPIAGVVAVIVPDEGTVSDEIGVSVAPSSGESPPSVTLSAPASGDSGAAGVDGAIAAQALSTRRLARNATSTTVDFMKRLPFCHGRLASKSVRYHFTIRANQLPKILGLAGISHPCPS